jgi:protein arginine kinase
MFAAWQQAGQIARTLGSALDFAHSARDGYLTTCSSNTGTGMRASVMLFLPALLRSKQISRMLRHIHAAGYTVRGMYGEGSYSFGSLVQISRHISAGQESRQRQSIQQLYAVCEGLIIEERRARRRLLASGGSACIQSRIEQVHRAVREAESIDFRAGMALVSKLRLATALRIEQQHRWKKNRQQTSLDERLSQLDRLTMRIQPAHVLKYGSRNRRSAGSYDQGPDSEEKLRAEMMQQLLKVRA